LLNNQEKLRLYVSAHNEGFAQAKGAFRRYVKPQLFFVPEGEAISGFNFSLHNLCISAAVCSPTAPATAVRLSWLEKKSVFHLQRNLAELRRNTILLLPLDWEVYAESQLCSQYFFQKNNDSVKLG
jgi:hypothetical protein